MLNTAQLRDAWAPACAGKGALFLAAFRALDETFDRHGYRPRPGVCGAYNCRKITGGTGYSLHSYGPGDPYTFWTGVRIATALAVDINWDRNPYGSKLVTDMPRAMIDEITAIRTNDDQQLWGWGGNYRGNKDAMHFEIVCSPASLRTGIRPTGNEDDMAQVPQDQWDAMVARVERLETGLAGLVSMMTPVFDALIRNAPPNGETMAQQQFRAVDIDNHIILNMDAWLREVGDKLAGLAYPLPTP